MMAMYFAYISEPISRQKEDFDSAPVPSVNPANVLLILNKSIFNPAISLVFEYIDFQLKKH